MVTIVGLKSLESLIISPFSPTPSANALGIFPECPGIPFCCLNTFAKMLFAVSSSIFSPKSELHSRHIAFIVKFLFPKENGIICSLFTAVISSPQIIHFAINFHLNIFLNYNILKL